MLRTHPRYPVVTKCRLPETALLDVRRLWARRSQPTRIDT